MIESRRVDDAMRNSLYASENSGHSFPSFVNAGYDASFIDLPDSLRARMLVHVLKPDDLKPKNAIREVLMGKMLLGNF